MAQPVTANDHAKRIIGNQLAQRAAAEQLRQELHAQAEKERADNAVPLSTQEG